MHLSKSLFVFPNLFRNIHSAKSMCNVNALASFVTFTSSSDHGGAVSAMAVSSKAVSQFDCDVARSGLTVVLSS